MLGEASLTVRATRAWLGISERDRRILTLAKEKLGSVCDFDEALRALREAVEEVIPAGRIYFLGTAADVPLVGSVVSGVGIMPAADRRIVVARKCRDGQRTVLGHLTEQ